MTRHPLPSTTARVKGGIIDLSGHRGNVRGFLHVCCLGNYREVTWEIVHALLESRLYDRSAAIEVAVLGSEADQRVVERMLRPFGRFRIGFRSTDFGLYEFPALGLLQDACQTWSGPVYYLHTKGVSLSPYNQHSRYWRRLMLDEVVTGHQRCLAALSEADTVGTNWWGDHYSGNFWWARAAHIRRLPDIRELRNKPRPVGRDLPVDGGTGSGRGVGPVWNTRLQCEHWLTMVPARFGEVGAHRFRHLYRRLCWTTKLADIVDGLLTSSAGGRMAEVTGGKARSGPAGMEATPPPGGDYDVISIDVRDDPGCTLRLIQRCLPKLSPDGVLVVHRSNPPSAWHQRPAQDGASGPAWTGQVWRAIVEFRSRNPWCEVFTIDTDFGCTVIRPSRRARHRLGAESVDALGWPELVRRRQELLNIVDVPWFRRYLYADPFVTGHRSPATIVELINVIVAAEGLDSYLHVGSAADSRIEDVIAPIRHSAAPDGRATYRLTPGEFLATDVGIDRYDVVFVDLPSGEEFAHDLAGAVARLSDRGWIATTEQPPADFAKRHPQFDCLTYQFDRTYFLFRRRSSTEVRPGSLRGLRELFCHAEDFIAHQTDSAAHRSTFLATQPYTGSRETLLAAVELNPDDQISMFNLGDDYFTAGDFGSARQWYERAVESRDWWWRGVDDSVYAAMLRVAQCMSRLGDPWPAVRDAYLRAWEVRPDRAAPLHAIAAQYSAEKRYQLGYLFAKPAAEIPCPPGGPEPDGWRVRDELAVCAYEIGKHGEAFDLWCGLLTRPDLPPADRRRIASNRDACVPAMLAAAADYPDAAALARKSGAAESGITVSLLVGPMRRAAEHTLNSFLNCSTDLARVTRWLVVDTGMSAPDRASLEQRYRFLEFVSLSPDGSDGVVTASAVGAHVDTRLWLHLGRDWRFFAPTDLITRLEAVLDAEPRVAQVCVNLDDDATLDGRSAAEGMVRRTTASGRYVPAVAATGGERGPAMFDTARLDRFGASGRGSGTASLDEVLCVKQTLITVIGRGNSGTRAISNTLRQSGVFMGEPIKEDSADLVPAEDMYEACRIISHHIPWKGGLEWDFGPVQTMPIPAEFTHLIERYLASVLDSAAPRAGWKLPETTLCYPWIRRLFPDIRYIFWVRNPLDCITRGHFTDDLRNFGIDYPKTANPYLRRAISWKYQNDIVAATPQPEHGLTVRLEDFVQHQENELIRLERFLGLPLARVPVWSGPIDRHKQLPDVPFPDFLRPAMRNYGYPT